MKTNHRSLSQRWTIIDDGYRDSHRDHCYPNGRRKSIIHVSIMDISTYRSSIYQSLTYRVYGEPKWTKWIMEKDHRSFLSQPRTKIDHRCTEHRWWLYRSSTYPSPIMAVDCRYRVGRSSVHEHARKVLISIDSQLCWITEMASSASSKNSRSSMELQSGQSRSWKRIIDHCYRSGGQKSIIDVSNIDHVDDLYIDGRFSSIHRWSIFVHSCDSN